MFGFKRSYIKLLILVICATKYWSFGSVLWWFWRIALCFISVLTVTTYDHDYWLMKGVFSPPSLPVVGHALSVFSFKEQSGVFFKRIYDKYKRYKFLGIHQFYQRTLVVCDPDLIKRICVADFHHFVDRGFFFDKDVDPLADSLLYLRGNQWRQLRNKISPIFSPNKLKGMLPLINNTAKEFLDRVLVRIADGNSKEFENETTDNKSVEEDGYAVVNSEKLLGGYTADAIVPCAFGLKSGVMDNENDPFAISLKAYYQLSPYNLIEKTMRQYWPSFVLFFKMRTIPKKTHDFFYNTIIGVIKAREKGEQKRRGDFLDMMMTLRDNDSNNNSSNKDKEEVEITNMVISANAFIILLGGFETTSATLAFLFLELADNSRVQEKMRQEIQEVLKKHGGEISYEVLQDLTYMEMVILETLRLYPPFPSIQRMCTKSYTIPETDVIVEKGTIVVFPTLGIHRDEKYFLNADSFIPERWMDGHQSPPGVYMPFGDGPRYCIGKRFAMIQMKCCLIKLLPHVRISSLNKSNARRESPFASDPRSPLTLHPANSLVRISLYK